MLCAMSDTNKMGVAASVATVSMGKEEIWFFSPEVGRETDQKRDKEDIMGEWLDTDTK